LAAGPFEDLVHFVDEELVFVVGELAVEVELFEFGGDSFGAGLAVLLEVGGFVGGAREGIDETSKRLGVAAQFLVKVAGVDVPEGEEQAGDGELKGGLIEFRGVEIIEEIKGGFLVHAEVFEPVLFEQPALVMRAGLPRGNIAGSYAFGLLAEPERNFRVGNAIAEHEVELVAGGFGEAADFAMGPALWGWGIFDF